MRPPSHLLIACIALALCVAPLDASAQSDTESLSESWYVLRGRANMKIGNYEAAIEAFEKATELNPDNRESMRSLGLAYEKQGLTAKAIEQFDRYLERFRDDPEIAFKQAEYLSWDRYAYRHDDAIRYYRMGLIVDPDLSRRHALARLLAQDRDRIDEALEQYRILLEAQPDNATWRAEYRDALLWDPSHLAEAVEEYRRLAAEKPDDFQVRHTLARLVARQRPEGEEAVSMYAALVALRPGDASLRLEYAQVLARHPGRRDQALEQYARVLKEQPRYETRVEYADLLSGRPFGREDALEQYVRLLRDRPDDNAVRLKYARLLGAEREDTERAIAQYDLVLERDPNNPTAHAGLATSYAWLEDRDRALAHANMAARHGGGGAIRDLRRDLLVGRESRVELLHRGLVQRGPSKAKLNGVGFGLRGQLDPSPFVTLRLEGGVETWWRSGDDTTGGYLSGGSELRLDPSQRIDLELGYHSLGRSTGRNVVGKAEYGRDGDSFDLRAGFARSLREDSYAAIVGDRVDGERIGSARENRFYARFEEDYGRLSAALEPYTGWVDAEGIDENPFVGLRGRLDLGLVDWKSWDLAGVLGMEIYHYRDDAFGLDPADSPPEPGGYFSPQLFFETTPGISTTVRFGESSFLDLEGGPALQIVNESGGGSEFKVGGHARLSYLLFIRDSIFWSFDAGFVRIGSAYTRADWRTGLTFKF